MRLPALASAVHRGFPCSHRGAHRVGQLALGRGRAIPPQCLDTCCLLPPAHPVPAPHPFPRVGYDYIRCVLRRVTCALRWGLVFHDGCAAEYQLIAPRRASPCPTPPACLCGVGHRVRVVRCFGVCPLCAPALFGGRRHPCTRRGGWWWADGREVERWVPLRMVSVSACICAACVQLQYKPVLRQDAAAAKAATPGNTAGTTPSNTPGRTVTGGRAAGGDKRSLDFVAVEGPRRPLSEQGKG